MGIPESFAQNATDFFQDCLHSIGNGTLQLGEQFFGNKTEFGAHGSVGHSDNGFHIDISHVVVGVTAIALVTFSLLNCLCLCTYRRSAIKANRELTQLKNARASNAETEAFRQIKTIVESVGTKGIDEGRASSSSSSKRPRTSPAAAEKTTT